MHRELTAADEARVKQAAMTLDGVEERALEDAEVKRRGLEVGVLAD